MWYVVGSYQFLVQKGYDLLSWFENWTEHEQELNLFSLQISKTLFTLIWVLSFDAASIYSAIFSVSDRATMFCFLTKLGRKVAEMQTENFSVQ